MEGAVLGGAVNGNRPTPEILKVFSINVIKMSYSGESVPQNRNGVVFVSDINDEQIGQAAGRPKPTSAFQAVLELTTDGFYRAGANHDFLFNEHAASRIVDCMVFEPVNDRAFDLLPSDSFLGRDSRLCALVHSPLANHPTIDRDDQAERRSLRLGSWGSR